MIHAVVIVNGMQYQVPQQGLRIGRAPENDVVLPDPNVSRQHLVIWTTDRGAFLRDLGSQNGTFIGGRRIGAGPEPVPTGTHVRIGVTDLQVEVTGGSGTTGPTVPVAPYGGAVAPSSPPYGGSSGSGGSAPYGGSPAGAPVTPGQRGPGGSYGAPGAGPAAGPYGGPAPAPYAGPSGPGAPGGQYGPRPAPAPSGGSTTGLIVGGVIALLVVAFLGVGALALNWVAESRERGATPTPTSRPVAAAATATIAPKPAATATTAAKPTAAAQPTAAPKPTEKPAAVPTPAPKPTEKPAGGRDPNFVRALNSAVRIIVPTGPSSASTGSGSILTPRGHILTNYHVVSDDAGKLINNGQNVIVAVPPNEGDAAAPKYRARVTEFDARLDLAIVQLTALANGEPLPGNLGLNPIPVGSSQSVQIGDTIIIIGFPGLGGSSLTVTRGIHSGIARFSDDPGSFIKTDTEINRGNSGGTAINAAGELIGVPTAGRFDREAPGKIGLVRPIDEARPLIEKATR
jgi:S1-C subfamily serine protease